MKASRKGELDQDQRLVPNARQRCTQVVLSRQNSQGNSETKLWPVMLTLRGMKFARGDGFGGKVAVKTCVTSWFVEALKGVCTLVK